MPGNSALSADGTNAVSENGDRIFFANPASGNSDLYMRENGTTTFKISQSECTNSCGSPASKVFAFANPSGSKVFFRTPEKLTNDDTASSGDDLYMYTHSANPGTDQNLTLLTHDSEPADGTAADFQGILGISNDGNTVYFVANGQIISDAPIATGPKVYRWQWNGGSPTVAYLATLSSSDQRVWNANGGLSFVRPQDRLVTPSGDDLLIETSAQLDPVADQDSSHDIYRWDSQSGWQCLSCQLPGTVSAGDASIAGTGYRAGNGSPALQNGELRVVISDDGDRTFFTTPDALVSGDQNGNVQDVYEWHDGTVSLISSGRSTAPSWLIAAGTSGNDVFFITREKLVGWDIDNNTDVYDARVGGGFPDPPVTGAPCEGDACRGAGTSPPAAGGAGSVAFHGPGNPTPKHHATPRKPHKKKQYRKPHKKKQQHRRHHAKRHHRAANHNRRIGR